MALIGMHMWELLHPGIMGVAKQSAPRGFKIIWDSYVPSFCYNNKFIDLDENIIKPLFLSGDYEKIWDYVNTLIEEIKMTTVNDLMSTIRDMASKTSVHVDVAKKELVFTEKDHGKIVVRMPIELIMPPKPKAKPKVDLKGPDSPKDVLYEKQGRARASGGDSDPRGKVKSKKEIFDKLDRLLGGKSSLGGKKDE